MKNWLITKGFIVSGLLLSCLNHTHAAQSTGPTTIQFYYLDPADTSPTSKANYTVFYKSSKATLEDKDMVVLGNWTPNVGNQFLYQKNTRAFDAAHTYGVVRRSHSLIRSDLQTLKDLYPSETRFNKITAYWDSVSYGKLKITPEAGVDANAYYERYGTNRNLKFFSFNSSTAGVVRTCQSPEIVAHEAGHAILDIMHPEYFDTYSLQTGGFHESFGDQMGIFWNLSYPELCLTLMNNTKGNLHATTKNFVAALAEKFGTGLGMPNGLRNADEDITLSQAAPEVHDISSVYTGAIYDALVDAYNEATYNVSNLSTKATKLFDVGRQLRLMTIESLVRLDNPSPSFSDFGSALINTAKQRAQSVKKTYLDSLKWSTHLSSQFSRRGIPLSANAKIDMSHISQEKKRICGTLMNACEHSH